MRNSRRVGLEMDQESYYPLKEAEVLSPPPGVVVAAEKWKGRRYDEVHAHNQILRIRAEDSHIGDEDNWDGNLRLKHKLDVAHFIVFSRQASPLSCNTTH
ncbi:hypothetical protein ABFS83_08G021700 [Erythranthe nasuta]